MAVYCNKSPVTAAMTSCGVDSRKFSKSNVPSPGNVSVFVGRSGPHLLLTHNYREKLEATDIFQTQTAHRPPKGPKDPVFVPGSLDLWPWTSKWSKRGTKHVFLVNLAQIHSAVPEIFHTQTKTTDWRRQKQNLPQFTACGKNLQAVLSKTA